MNLKYLATVCFLLTAFTSFSPAQDKSGQNKTTTVKLQPVVFGGNRYVVEADFGLGEKVPMMIHGNARFYMMLTHDIAEQLNNGQPLIKVKDYGYSEKGMARINIARFSVGNKIFTNITNAPVFDWPAEEGKAAQGMLGIDFLKNEKVRIDFVKEEMTIGLEQQEQPDKKMIDQGYLYTRFFIEKGEGFMNVFFDDLQKEIAITVGTVSDDYSLDLVTFQETTATEKTGEKGHSPNDTRPQVYINKEAIKYKIAGHSFDIPPGKAEMYSIAEYENVQQTELFPFGIFGRDWMKENNAVIDYANLILYFKPGN